MRASNRRPLCSRQDRPFGRGGMTRRRTIREFLVQVHAELRGIGSIGTEKARLERDFPQVSVRDIVNESANYRIADPVVRPQSPHLLADIFRDVAEGMKGDRSVRRNARLIFNQAMEIRLRDLHQSAIGVIDDHDFPRFQQVL
jgi:hypothetical protein